MIKATQCWFSLHKRLWDNHLLRCLQIRGGFLVKKEVGKNDLLVSNQPCKDGILWIKINSLILGDYGFTEAQILAGLVF